MWVLPLFGLSLSSVWCAFVYHEYGTCLILMREINFMQVNECRAAGGEVGEAREASGSPLAWFTFGFLNRQCAVTPTLPRSKPNQNRATAGSITQGVATKNAPSLILIANNKG